MFRTTIGFHDAYVAAPSQKAALEAWGAESNLFAQGIAEQVSEPELMKVPLERPGEVIKVLRGSAEEQVRALDAERPEGRRRKANGSGTKEGGSRIKSGMTKKKRPARPSRAAVDKAESAVEAAEREHRAAIAELRAEEKKLEERKRKLEDQQQAEMQQLRKAAEAAQEKYSEAMAEWSGRM